MSTPRTDLTGNPWTALNTKPGPRRCCAKCRRGTPSHGEIPCAYMGECRCHQTTEGTA